MTSDPLTQPDRIAFAGDWHANTHHAEIAIERAHAEGVQTILHLGDYAYVFPRRYLSAQEPLLARYGMHLLFVPGNHDDYRQLARYTVYPNGLIRIAPHIWALPRGYRWEWGGVRFLACGGAYSVDRHDRVPGIEWWPEEEITEQDIAACGTERADVLLAHDCPAGVIIPGADDVDPATLDIPWIDLLRSAEHRQQLRRIVDATRPRWIWHGHYHRLYQREVDLGYGPVTVTGLDRDGRPLADNLHVVDLAELTLALAAGGDGPLVPATVDRVVTGG